MIWRVGDGTSINIWGDRWIPSPSTYAIQTPIWILDSEAKVSSLTDPVTNWWNIPLINEALHAEEAIVVCNIPICLQRQKDRLVWVGTKNGDFTVRSAYHIAKNRIEANHGSSSIPVGGSNIWKIVWNMKVPAATKMFLSKACNNILPTKLNLHKKGVTENSLCPICCQEEESVEHILWNYEAARDVWAICSNKV